MLALLIFLLTLILVIWQPRGLGIGWSAAGGALVSLLTGVVHWHDVPVVWHIVWDATFTFVALIVISLILDEAGLFRWAALHLARWGGGNGRRLFVLTLLLGALTAAVFANDGAALLLTPIVMAILAQLRFAPAASLAFIVATGFAADSTSLPLVISNLVNLVSANYFDVSFDAYARVMMPVNLASLLLTLLVLGWYYRKAIPAQYALEGLERPGDAVRDPLVFRAAAPIMVLLLIAYFTTAQFGVPVAFVTGLAAMLLLALAGRWHRGGTGRIIALGRVMREAPWQIVVFSVGMYLVVYGLRNAGMTQTISAWLVRLAEHGPVATSVGTGVMAALLSSVMNNLPSVLIGALSIPGAHQIDAGARQLMIYANVIGCDLGPKLTPIGSLATLLWLHVLQQKGVRITWGQYMRIGVVITPPVLLGTLLCLALWGAHVS